jgi:PAS domain S-box-containing protein
MPEHDPSDLILSMEIVCATSREPIALLERDGTVLWANASMRRTYGVDPHGGRGGLLGELVCARDPNTHDPVTLAGATHDDDDPLDCTTRHVLGHVVRVACERRLLSEHHGHVMVTLRDVTWRHCQMGLHAARAAMLDVPDAGLEDTLQKLLDTLYDYTIGMAPTVMLYEPESRTLTCAASRGLPKGYVEQLVDAPIGVGVGTCSHAVATNQRTITEDFLTDPRWATFTDLARQSSMRSCWSEPIRSSDGQMLGSFALYYGEPRVPTDHELLFFTEAAGLVRETIERARHASEVREVRRRQERIERRFQQLHYHAADAIVTADAQRYIVNVNEAAEAMFGWPREELLGKRIEVLVPFELQTFHQGAASRFVLKDTHDRIPPRVIKARKRDGEIIDAEASLFSFADGGEFFATAIIRDLSEVRRLERLHAHEATLRKLIVDHVPAMIYWQGVDRAIQGCNIAFANALGYATPDDLIGTRGPVPLGWTVLAHIDPLDEDRMLAGEIEAHTQEFVLQGPQGQERTVVVENTCIRDDHDEIIGLLGVCTDVTDTRRAAARAVQQQKLEALGRLVGGVAHDFNNMLFVIQSNLELIEDTLEPDDTFARTCAREALVASERGSRLTRQLLSSSRRATLTPTVVDLNDTLDRVHSMLARTLPATISVHLERTPYTCMARVDQSLTENALLNLAINARDAMKGNGTLTLSVDEVHLEGGPGLGLSRGAYARVRVRDEGEGMTPDVLASAFDPFFTTKPVDEGTGMGLAMVHGFVHQSGGAITLESEPGEGTTVTLYFPSHSGSPDHESEVEDVRDDARVLRVLLVEDDPHVRSALTNLLASMNHEVIAVEDAHAALDRLDAASEPRLEVDLILSDAVMPGTIQGPELAEHVGRMRPGLPIVLMSGYPILPSSDAMISTHIHLSKPFTRAALTQAMNEATHAPEG